MSPLGKRLPLIFAGTVVMGVAVAKVPFATLISSRVGRVCAIMVKLLQQKSKRVINMRKAPLKNGDSFPLRESVDLLFMKSS
jgi:hypothetical protein